MILTGSRAAEYWFPNSCQPKDWDFICPDRRELIDFVESNRQHIRWSKLSDAGRYYRVKFRSGEFFEFELPVEGDNSHSISELIKQSSLTVIDVPYIGKSHILSLTDLFWMKWSHIIRPIHWEKNIAMYHQLRTLSRVDVTQTPDWANIRRLECETRWPIKINLNKSNESFFSKSQQFIGRVIEHDDLHRATCFGFEPIFLKLKINKSLAKIEKFLWDRLDICSQCNAVKEECFAIALEKVLIPKYTIAGLVNGDYSDEVAISAYHYALRRICTTLTKGWFRQFAIDWYPVLHNMDSRYMVRFKDWMIKNGKS